MALANLLNGATFFDMVIIKEYLSQCGGKVARVIESE